MKGSNWDNLECLIVVFIYSTYETVKLLESSLLNINCWNDDLLDGLFRPLYSEVTFVFETVIGSKQCTRSVVFKLSMHHSRKTPIDFGAKN